MNKLKFTVLLLLLLSPLSFATQWDHGSLSLVGNYNGDYFVKVTNITDNNNAVPSYTEKLFKLSNQLGKDGFAVALAAISSKKQVYLNSDVDNQTGSYPVISVIYLTNKPAIE